MKDKDDTMGQSQAYVLKVQYLGFRYSGWQKQPGQRTVEGMVEKTLRHVLPHGDFKVLGAGRTDAKVSVNGSVFQLFLKNGELDNADEFMKVFNKNLPQDIRVLEILKVGDGFNVIRDARQKEYVYLFSHGGKNHPYCAPFMANFMEVLNLEQMQMGAKLFEGTHDFSSFTAHLRSDARAVRTVDHCEIRENRWLTASFFPKRSYALVVRGNGFMRYQIRMMMGALVQLGKGELSMDAIEKSLTTSDKTTMTFVAPGSGLHLNTLDFDIS